VGTLQYLAPECLHAPADCRADVYSLGLTLYELLTLKPAYAGWHPATLMKHLQEREPEHPRQLNPAIPRDLEAIVLKAIARDPQRRYRYAGELSKDLQRYLDDRPVNARAAGAAERLLRWSRRNRVVAALAAMLFLVLIAGFAGVLWMWRQAVAEYARAEVHLELANQALDREATERDKAQAATARAESNVRLSLSALEEIFNAVAPEDVGPWSATVAGASSPGFFSMGSEEEAAVLQGVLNFFEQFAEKNDTDPKLQEDAANAYRRVGDLRARLGQTEKAELAYRRAAAMLEKLTANYPQTIAYRFELAETYTRADLRVFRPRTSSVDPAALTEAVKHLRQALALAEPFVGAENRAAITQIDSEGPHTPESAPHISQWIALAGRIHARLGLLLERLDRTSEAETAFRQAARLRSQLAAANSQISWYSYEAAVSKRLLADCLNQQQEKLPSSAKLTEARSLLEASVEELQSILKAEPRFGAANFALASAFHSLSAVLNRLGEKALAEEANRKADAITRMPASRSPGSGARTQRQP
jgi:tetratricopeptide (TPR) repeat protein